MLSTARTVVRRGAIGLAGTAAVGTTAATAYVYTDDGSRRQVRFWSRIFPIVADYYIHTAQSSPYVKLQDYMLNNDGDGDTGETKTEEETKRNKEEQRKRRKKAKLDELHEKHAPDILQVMLDLKGLYVKLGQVLSVTALPVPEPYRVKFRTLQSDVPGWEEFEEVVKPTLEKEFGKSLEEIFEHVDPIPCGAASIGQAHKARLKTPETGGNDKSRDVIVKVQYPAASWQVPADIECVGDFLKICVYFGVVDEESAKMSYDEFSRQFLAELDYNQERENLQLVYESSLDPSAPYQKRGVVIPKPYDDLCTGKVITMSYLPGPKLEEEAKRQLESLGIDTSGGISQIIKDAAKDAANNPDEAESGELVRRVTRRIDEAHHSPFSWKVTASRIFSQVFGFDSILWAVRAARRVVLWSQAGAVACIQSVPQVLVSQKWTEWANAHQTASAQAQRLSLTAAWIDALFDVHGHQVFTLGAFNSDPHPGNILVIEEEDGKPSTRLGLIDYGQCKHLKPEEQYKVARLILSVANNEPDANIAKAFRDLNIVTKNDSTEFLAKFGRLMFGEFKPEHLSHDWHKKLHSQDKVLYFPKELSMVYRTSLLLRGLAVSLQLNRSIGQEWKNHAQTAVDRLKDKIEL